MSDKKYTFFWRTESPFSQWHPSEFSDPEITGIKFTCAEQYMMYRKAILFNDNVIAGKTILAKHPREMKALGRQIKSFNAEQWDKVKCEIVKRGNILKFSQNPEMLKKLEETKGTELVESSPYDTVWGIGLSADDERAGDKSTWRGQNLLGIILTEVREELETSEK